MEVQADKDLSGYREAELKALEIAPIFMQELGLSEMQSCMHWGLSWGEGWDSAFLELARKIEEINNKHNDIEIVASQCKSKFGMCCVYWELKEKEYPACNIDAIYKEASDLINAFTAEMSQTCESCGEPLSDAKCKCRRRRTKWNLNRSEQ
jgi:hypothetical protein